jgi:hypothetical protein
MPDAQHDQPLVFFGRILADVGEIEIKGHDGAAFHPTLLRYGAIARAAQPLIE